MTRKTDCSKRKDLQLTVLNSVWKRGYFKSATEYANSRGVESQAEPHGAVVCMIMLKLNDPHSRARSRMPPFVYAH